MANPFDQFDAAPNAGAPNPFDRFDEKPTAVAPTASEHVDFGPADPDGALAIAGNDNSDAGTAGAFVRGAERGVLPAAGGIVGAGAGAALGGTGGAALGALTGPLAPIAVPALGAVGGVGGGLAGAFAGATAVGKAQEWVLNHAPDRVVKALGLDKEQQAKDQAEHPIANFAGELAPNLLAFRPGSLEAAREGAGTVERLMAHPVTARGLPAAIMAGQEVAAEKLDGQDIDPTKVAIASAVGAASNKMTKIGHFLTGSGVGPVIGLQAALRNRGKGGEPDFAGMRDITPEKPGPAPAGTPQLEAPIDPQDIHPGDEESPIPTSIIAEGRRQVREATDQTAQEPDIAPILTRNGWPQHGSRVILNDGEGPTATGVIHGAYNTLHPELGVPADALMVRLDSGHMFTAFKHEIDAAGIAITPEQAQQAGLPFDIATQPSAAGQPPAATAEQAQAAAPVAETGTPSQEASQPPVIQPMPVDLFQPARVSPSGDNAALQESPADGRGADTNAPSNLQQAGALPIKSDSSVEVPAQRTVPLISRTEAAILKSIADGGASDTKLIANSAESQSLAAKFNRLVDAPPRSPALVQGDVLRLGHDLQVSGGIVKSIPVSVMNNLIGPERTAKMVLDHKAVLETLAPDSPHFNAYQAVRSVMAGEKPNMAASAGSSHDVAPGEVKPTQVLNSSNNASPPAPIIKTARAALTPSRETSVLENIRRMGGIKTVDGLGRPTKEGQDIAAVLKDVNRPGLINNKTGQPADTIRERLKEQGWFGGSPEHGTDIQHLYDLIDKEVRQGPQYHPESDRGRAVAERAVTDDNARVLAEVHAEAKKGGGRPLTPEEAEQIVVNMGAHGINAEDAVADFIENKALREQYEDDAKEVAHAPAAPESVNRGTSEADRAHGQGGEEPAPASSNTNGTPGGGLATPGDTGQAHLATERDAEGLATDHIPPLRHGDGSWMIVDRATGKVVTELFKDSKAIHKVDFEKYKVVPAGEYLAGLNKKPELTAEPGPAVDGQGKPVDQTIVPGAEKSAQQLAKAREASGHGRVSTSVAQKDAGGMFTPKVEEAKDLFTPPAVEPKHLTAANQTKTPEFKKWFGGSKVVDANGDPLVVYHGTNADFNTFDTAASEGGSHFGTVAQAHAGGKTKIVVPTYLRIEAPLRLKDVGSFSSIDVAQQLEDLGIAPPGFGVSVRSARADGDAAGIKLVQQAIEKAGYDGIVYLNREEGVATSPEDIGHTAQPLTDKEFAAKYPDAADSYVAFRPEQIKSATGNSGAFDGSNGDIRFMPSADQTGVENGRSFKIAAPQTPEFRAQRELVAREVRKNLDKIGLTDVGLKVADAINMHRNGTDLGSSDGMYWRGIVTLALGDDTIGVAHHEAIHALNIMGLFKKTEWAMLAARAASHWREQFSVDERWGHLGLSEEVLNEEAVAEAYRAYKNGENVGGESGGKTGFFARLFDRMRNAISAIAGALKGLGFRTPEDIFADIDSGKVGGRERPFADHGQDREPSFSPADEHQAAFDQAWDATIAASAKKLGWEGEPTSRAMFAKALLTPKGPAKTELYRNAGLIKTMEDQRATPFKQPVTPIQGTGESKPRGLSAGIEAKAVEKKLTDSFGPLPEYRTVNMKDQAARAAKFLEQDYEAAKAVAMGEEPAPFGVLPESILVAVENRAIKGGDTETLRQIATNSSLNIEATTMGQRIRTLGERDPTSPVAAIKAINDARQAAAKAKGVDPKKAKSSTVKDMLDAIKKETDKSAKRVTWETFLHSITCDASGKPK